jgi:hypothetical protein
VFRCVKNKDRGERGICEKHGGYCADDKKDFLGVISRQFELNKLYTQAPTLSLAFCEEIISDPLTSFIMV